VQVPVRIIQIDSSGGQSAEASVVDMRPEGLSAEQQAVLGSPKVHMLYRPGELQHHITVTQSTCSKSSVDGVAVNCYSWCRVVAIAWGRGGVKIN
jgi:hypothetical protein